MNLRIYEKQHIPESMASLSICFFSTIDSSIAIILSSYDGAIHAFDHRIEKYLHNIWTRLLKQQSYYSWQFHFQLPLGVQGRKLLRTFALRRRFEHHRLQEMQSRHIHTLHSEVVRGIESRWSTSRNANDQLIPSLHDVFNSSSEPLSVNRGTLVSTTSKEALHCIASAEQPSAVVLGSLSYDDGTPATWKQRRSSDDVFDRLIWNDFTDLDRS